ncbi:MAG TPA: GFA family protein [Gammaproteobacteria bacterium]|nr:GFA family protein [Gammaproteobacteria bacterium]
MSKPIKGGCLCGRVQYQVTGPFERFHLCHCSQCRRSTGSAHAANIFTTGDRIEWLAGEELIKQFTPDEPNMISKCFCSHCGSLVPYISLSSGKLIIPAGSLHEPPDIAPDDNIFWRDRADWYDAGLAAVHVDQEPEG